ncbi:pyocin knob domain-containing protein [Chromobacterium violaceum]|uniref:pyocin knob domain-containing protein n=1 Tax=Chromobacterium violaceum TaxID=536 RepID=UPI0035A65B75
MQDVMQPINTPDKLFQDGNPATGQPGTIVSAAWLNAVQGATRSTQAELLSVLAASGIAVDPAKQDQLLAAIKKLVLSSPAFDGTPTVPTPPFGDNSKKIANTEYLASLGIGGVSVSTAVDMNAYGVAGIYVTPNANAMTNVPSEATTGRLVLIVGGGSPYVSQMAFGTNADAGKFWTRSLSGSIWSPWVSFATVSSPALSGTPTVPTPAPGANSKQIANVEFVQATIAALVASSPAALDTLYELAAALGNDPNFATTVTNALAAKAPLESPALIGTPTVPTPVFGDSSQRIVNTEYLASLGIGGVGSVSGFKDCNAYTTAGKFVTPNANTMTNAPPGSTTGRLVMEVAGGTGSYVSQTAYGTGADVGKVWTRVLSGTWSAWKQQVTLDQFSFTPSPSGSLILPNGLIMQWARVTGNGTFSWPSAFPNGVVFAQVWDATSFTYLSVAPTGYDRLGFTHTSREVSGAISTGATKTALGIGF